MKKIIRYEIQASRAHTDDVEPLLNDVYKNIYLNVNRPMIAIFKRKSITYQVEPINSLIEVPAILLEEEGIISLFFSDKATGKRYKAQDLEVASLSHYMDVVEKHYPEYLTLVGRVKLLEQQVLTLAKAIQEKQFIKQDIII